MRMWIMAAFGVFMAACSAPYSEDLLKNEFDYGNISPYFNAQKSTDSIFDIFQNADFRDLVNLALKNNSDIFIYENRINIAKSQAKIALSNQMPSLNANASYQFNGDSSINTNLMASWELDIFGKYAQSKNAYDELINAAHANLAYFKISLISDIALAYHNIKYLTSNIELTKMRIKNYYDLVEIMNQTYKSGLVDFANFMETKAFLQSEEQNLNMLQNSLIAQINAIKILLGDMNFEAKNIVGEMGAIIYLGVNLESSAEIILNRPDIKAQIANLNANIYRLNSARAQMYPSINLSGSLSKAFLNPTDLAYQIVSSLALPLFSRFEIYENINIAKYTQMESYYSLQKAIYTAASEINNAIYQIQTNKNLLQISNEMLNENIEILEVLRESNALGLVDSIQYLNAINSNLLMMKNNNTAHFNTISSIIYLYRAIGGNLGDIESNISAQNVESSTQKGENND